jgi:hypothetical protein
VAIPDDKVVLLEKEVIEEEIQKTIFHMKANKAPSSDGFFVEFFKATWPIVGKKVIVAIKGFSAMGDFRPISCCNVIYKCITKIISNKMLLLLGDLVSMN